jgi:hypothetical protein
MRRILLGLTAGLLSLGGFAFWASPAMADYHHGDRGRFERREHVRWEHGRREAWDHRYYWPPYRGYVAPRPGFYPVPVPGYYCPP